MRAFSLGVSTFHEPDRQPVEIARLTFEIVVVIVIDVVFAGVVVIIIERPTQAD